MNHRQHEASSTSGLVLALAAGWILCGCGTVVGNPKKPKDEQKPNQIAFKLPELDLAVPGLATDADAALALAPGDDFENGDKSILTSWGKRLARKVDHVNKLSQRINKILDKHEDEQQGGVLVFRNRGDDSQFSGKLSTLPPGGEFAYEAVLCHGGSMISHMKWSEAADKVELTRDFGVKSAAEDESFALVTRMRIEKTDKLALELASQGQLTDDGLGGNDGPAFTEASRVERDANGSLRLKAVGDNHPDSNFPADGAYEGDRYLVGQISDAGAEFAGYYKGFAKPCKNGFDEAADDLWHPGEGRPRFCVGRPAGGKRFKTVQQYYDTLERLEPIGLLSKTELKSVKFDDGLSCE